MILKTIQTNVFMTKQKWEAWQPEVAQGPGQSLASEPGLLMEHFPDSASHSKVAINWLYDSLLMAMINTTCTHCNSMHMTSIHTNHTCL